jgi:hypothetical protein
MLELVRRRDLQAFYGSLKSGLSKIQQRFQFEVMAVDLLPKTWPRVLLVQQPYSTL